MNEPFTVTHTLDIRYTKCPLNFVKVRLALEKLSAPQVLAVILMANGESAINVPKSLQQEGYCILDSKACNDNNEQTLWVQAK
jgi:tRNA 2-thiouridine synthesizing protein A